MNEKVLVINPGSTSTKVALYSNDEKFAEETINHTLEEIESFDRIPDQKTFRQETINGFLTTHLDNLNELTAVVGRGGLLKPIVGGTYLVNDAMLEDLEEEKYGSHASNLGAIISNEIAQVYDIPAYIVDPVVVDELDPLARISGLEGIERRSVGHPLNQKAVGRQVAQENNKEYTESNLIVAHMGGGISIGAHKKGQIIEMINGLDGEGPYSPERVGELPLIDFVQKVLDEDLDLNQVKKITAGNGGLKSYINDTDIRIVEKRILNGDEEAKYYLDGMCYQIAKSIGSIAPVLQGEIDSVVLTGGVAYSKYVVAKIRSYIDWIAPVSVVPGEEEMRALYEGVKRVTEGIEKSKTYNR